MTGAPAASVPGPPVSGPVLRRAVVAASVGNAMEWFDFGVYNYLANTIGRVFFPGADPGAGQLAAWRLPRWRAG